MAALHTIDSDAAFARRLQEAELGGAGYPQLLIQTDNSGLRISQSQLRQNNTPNNANRNPTVINARYNEITTEKIALYAILIINIPQIVAAMVILTTHWNDSIDPNECDSSYIVRWKIWSSFSAIRMSAYSVIAAFMYFFKSWLLERPRLNAKFIKIRSIIDLLGLVWFVIGNMWCFSSDSTSPYSCVHPEVSAIYKLCQAMIIINYIQICLPCLVAAAFVPIFCFCLPCLIRLLARMQTNLNTQGASADIIASVPLIIIGQNDTELPPGQDRTCPICLNDMVAGEEARLLHCKHMFHKNCVDEWLRVNCTCPTCRESILQPTPSSSSSSSNHVSNSEENGIELHPTSSTLLNSNNPRGNYSQLLQQP